ncbi:MAG: tripartite tricarboxylate transporter substrate binding protein [Candidatus Rokubacteria bacterium]|nr:tripartite tricarboxylate transporter substrate binding protein [Candidatus Rokubacteria bacterium]MBI4254231.1 tripartite tricarboxylate transporter substrate binding protein [Candidatus Rokubacteria bacterium]
MNRIFLGIAALLALALAGWPVLPASAQARYPVRPIEFVIPFPPGGPADTAARIIQPQMSAALGVPIVLVNKPGGGGALGADYVAKSKPDGYTVYATTNSTLTIITAMQPDLTYRPSDFAAVGSYLTDLSVITAKAGGPWKTLEEFVEHAKKNPGKLSYGSAGLGTVSFFTMELFKLAYGLDITHVPFQGTGPAKNAIMGGHVTVASSGLSSFAPLMRSGDLVALVTTAPKRIAAFPTVPTLAEKGAPEASLNIWMALFVPARTPREAVDRLAQALDKTMKEPSVVAAAEKAGMVIDVHDPAGTAKLVEAEHEAVKKVVGKLGIGKK